MRDRNKIKGQVIEAYPGANFLVKLVDGREVRCYISGKMWKSFIRVIPGDWVDVVLAPTEDNGRIVFRHR